jgi:hypothetical protein
MTTAYCEIWSAGNSECIYFSVPLQLCSLTFLLDPIELLHVPLMHFTVGVSCV